MYARNVVAISASGLKHEFTFDTIYQSDSTQHQVFETAAVPIVKAATEGYNGTNTYLNKQTYIHTHIRTYIHTYIHAYIYIYMQTNKQTYIHTYIHI